MKTLFNRYVVVLIVLVLMGAGTLLAQNEHASGTGVEGTYLTNVIPDPNGPPPFQALFTLSAGGAIVETETDQQITGQGTWKQTGNSISFTLLQFEFVGGVWDGTYVAKGTLTYDPVKQTLASPSPFNVSFYSTSGALLFSGTGTLSGSRVQAQ